jgi:carboxymethylenebutenolidase
MGSFLSGSKSIRIDHYPPRTAGSSPAILLVHGSGGPMNGIDPFAQQATAFGVHVFVVHYFERTGHSWVYPSQVEPHFADWMETLKDALSFVSEQPGVDAKRIGLLGFSLGGYLSLALATQDDRIAAVAELVGGLPEALAAEAKNLPPVIILHGGKDQTVPVQQAYRLEELLKQHNVPYEIKIYPDHGHIFQGLAQFDAMRRVAGFFRRHLLKAA